MTDILEGTLDWLKRLEGRIAHLETQSIPQWKYLTAPLTSTSWDGDAKNNTTDRATIDLSAVFNVPAGIKAVEVRLETKDATVGSYACLGPSASYAAELVNVHQVANVLVSQTAIVNCDANGDIYFYDSEAIDWVKIEIWAYQI